MTGMECRAGIRERSLEAGMECAGRNMHNHCAAIYINVEQCDDTHLNEKTMSIISRDAAEARNGGMM